MTQEKLEQLKATATEVRRGILTEVHAAKSGHPGGSLSVADIITYLYSEVLRVDPENPRWEDRDRLVLSKGHTCPALYAMLAEKGFFPKEELLGYGVSENDLILTEAPSAEELARLDPFYMSYFVPWNSYKNYQIAKEHGFHDLTHEWDRTHHAENFDQIDSRAYLVHSWLKYPKFGHAAATDYTARYIRYGMMTREEAIPIIKERDGALDPLCVRDFCAFCGYTETEFWAIMDKFYNRDLFEKDEYGRWMLKEPIWKEN